MRHNHLTRFSMSLLACLALALAATAQEAPNSLSAKEKADGWRLLFDGSTTTGWRGYKKADMAGQRWAVKDGAICLPKADGADTRGHRDIISSDKFSDFDLTWEWKVDVGSNSGLKYFVTETRDAAIGHEYQLIEGTHADAASTERRTASFYDVKAPTGAQAKPAGQWNTSRVLVQGNHVEHWLNGTKVLEYELGSPELLALVKDSKFKDMAGFGTKVQGHILLQDHGDSVCYRNIKIRPGTT